MKQPIDADCLRAAVKQIRQVYGYIEGLLPMDVDDASRPESERLEYITRGRSFADGFKSRNAKKKQLKGGQQP